MSEHRILSIDYELQDGYAARIDCACGWWWIAANDPRYDSIEEGGYHLAATSRNRWVELLAEAEALPDGRVRDDAIKRYQAELNYSEAMIERGMLESKDDTLWRSASNA